MDGRDRPEPAEAWTADSAARALGLTVSGPGDVPIRGAADVREARDGDVVFAESESFARLAARSAASVVILQVGVTFTGQQTVLVAPSARTAFSQMLSLLARPPVPLAGVHATAVIAPDARLGAGVVAGPYAVIGPEAELDDGVIAHEAVHIGSGCRVGAGTVLHPNVVLYSGVQLGAGCVVHAGTVIGSDGFGFVQVAGQLRRVPHLGTVVVEDGVEIGSNCCIDRAKTGATVIGAGTRIDNLVHIAHNVRIGRSCVIVAQVGIAGSSVVGDAVTIAGQAGVKDHVEIGSGATVTASAGVTSNVAPGETVTGFPARSHRARMREYAALTLLPEYVRRIQALERRIEELERAAAGRG